MLIRKDFYLNFCKVLCVLRVLAIDSPRQLREPGYPEERIYALIRDICI